MAGLLVTGCLRAFNGNFHQRRRLGAVDVCYIGKDIRQTGVKFGFESAFEGII